MDLERALQLARERQPESQELLENLLRIPSVSALPEHHADCRRAAEWVADRLRHSGLQAEVVDVLRGGHPVVAAEWLGAGPDAPTLAIYGHYDVQPPDPLDEWNSPPFEPVVRDGLLYARGADDNKGQLMCGVRAAELAFAAGGPPVNLRFLIEGEEEVGGQSLPAFLRRDAERLPTDHVFIADGQFVAPGLPNLLTGLRGLLYTEIEAVGAEVDLHSGIFGGVAPNPLNTLGQVIAALKDPEGRVQVPGFYDDVVPPTPEELEGWKRLPIDDRGLQEAMGVHALEGEPGYTAVERKWARPTLDVHGISGGFQGEGQKTVIPARARAKISMRLVPDQDPERIFAAFTAFVGAHATPGIRLAVRKLSAARPLRTGTDHKGAVAARTAYRAAFGAEPVLTREGGSIPVTIDFQEALGANLVVTGFGLPDDALHSPNEHFALDQYFRGIEMLLHLMNELARAS